MFVSHSKLWLSGVLLSSVCLTGSLTACQTSTNPTQSTEAKAVKVMNNQSLEDYQWTLIKAYTKNQQPIKELTTVIADKKATLAFQKGKLSTSVGCNQYFTSYTLNENKLATGEMASTMMLCRDLDNAERTLAKYIEGQTMVTVKSQDNQVILTQETASGEHLIWQGQLKNEVKYGEADIQFFAIRKQSEPCPNSQNPATACLQVKPVQYDNQGIKKSEGDWQWLNKPIEGYQLDDGLEQVVRVKRFAVERSDVKGKTTKYVLDQVVESRAVKD